LGLLHDLFPFCVELSLSSLLPPLLRVKTTSRNGGNEDYPWKTSIGNSTIRTCT
jgi:hypothetical protein